MIATQQTSSCGHTQTIYSAGYCVCRDCGLVIEDEQMLEQSLSPNEQIKRRRDLIAYDRILRRQALTVGSTRLNTLLHSSLNHAVAYKDLIFRIEVIRLASQLERRDLIDDVMRIHYKSTPPKGRTRGYGHLRRAPVYFYLVAQRSEYLIEVSDLMVVSNFQETDIKLIRNEVDPYLSQLGPRRDRTAYYIAKFLHCEGKYHLYPRALRTMKRYKTILGSKPVVRAGVCVILTVRAAGETLDKIARLRVRWGVTKGPFYYGLKRIQTQIEMQKR